MYIQIKELFEINESFYSARMDKLIKRDKAFWIVTKDFHFK